MTKEEFLTSVNNWDDLMSFVSDNEIGGAFDEVFSASNIDEQIDEDIIDALRYDRWTTIRDMLNNIGERYTGYVRRYDAFDYYQLTDGEFGVYKQYAIDFADRHGSWDEERDECDSSDILEQSKTQECDEDAFELSVPVSTLFE